MTTIEFATRVCNGLPVLVEATFDCGEFADFVLYTQRKGRFRRAKWLEQKLLSGGVDVELITSQAYHHYYEGN